MSVRKSDLASAHGAKGHEGNEAHLLSKVGEPAPPPVNAFVDLAVAIVGITKMASFRLALAGALMGTSALILMWLSNSTLGLPAAWAYVPHWTIIISLGFVGAVLGTLIDRVILRKRSGKNAAKRKSKTDKLNTEIRTLRREQTALRTALRKVELRTRVANGRLRTALDEQVRSKDTAGSVEEPGPNERRKSASR
jgi:hypothetical protein